MPTRSLIGCAAALCLVLALAAPASAEEWKSETTPAPTSDGAVSAPAASGQPAAVSGDLVDGIAAQVGTEVVLVSEVDRVAAPIESKIREQGASDADIALLRSDVLDKLIERRLIALLAKRAEIEANDFEIDDAIAGIAKENNLGVDGLKQSVESQGLSFEAYRRRIAEEIVQQKVISGMVRPRVKVDDDAGAQDLRPALRRDAGGRRGAAPRAHGGRRGRRQAEVGRSWRATRCAAVSRGCAPARASERSRWRCRRRARTSAGCRGTTSRRGCRMRPVRCNPVRSRA